MTSLNRHDFLDILNQAIQTASQVLQDERKFQIADKMAHSRADQFQLVELLVCCATRALRSNLNFFGLNHEILKKCYHWAQSDWVSLRLHRVETCAFAREEKKTLVESESSWLGWISQRVEQTVLEYYWHFEVSWELVVQGREESISLFSHVAQCELKTLINEPPRPVVVEMEPLDCPLNWWLACLNEDLDPSWSIQRDHVSCHTPRRNEETLDYLTGCLELLQWAHDCVKYFQRLSYLESSHLMPISDVIDATRVFIPVLPLFSQQEDGVCLFTDAEVNSLLDLQQQQMNEFLEKIQQLDNTEEESQSNLLTSKELTWLVVLTHSAGICAQFAGTLDYIESIIEKKMIQALGRCVTPYDLQEYMHFHYRKHFHSSFSPTLLSYPVRRPKHVPEGEFTLFDPRMQQPALAFTRELPHAPVSMSLHAGADVTCQCAYYLHGLLRHRFEDSESDGLILQARSRQFSGFLIVLGNLISDTRLSPKHAILVQNREAFSLPLLLETIPTAAAFRDATASLSPTQREFAQAYRSMQLESSMFGILVIQIKPQLEKILRVPEDSLTKHIRLNRQLLQLFTEYQMSSDMLRLEEHERKGNHMDMVGCVAQHTQKILLMIAAEKQRQLDEIRAAEERKRLQEQREREKEIAKFQSLATLQQKVFYVCVLRSNSSFINFYRAPQVPSIIGNIVQLVASKMDMSVDHRKTYERNELNIHIHVQVVNELGYFMVTSPNYSARDAFQFLRNYQRAISDGRPFSIQEELERLDQETCMQVKNIQRELDETRELMSQQLDKILERGERLDLLECKSDMLSLQAGSFQKSAQSTRFGGLGSMFSKSPKASQPYTPTPTPAPAPAPAPPASSTDHTLDEIIASVKNTKAIAFEVTQELEMQRTMLDQIDQQVELASPREQGKNEPAEPTIEESPDPVEPDLEEPGESIINHAEESKSYSVMSLPSRLEKHSELQGVERVLNPVIIKVGAEGMHQKPKGLVSQQMSEEVLNEQGLSDAKKKAFDLLDALSCSGSMSIDNCSFHVVVAMSHAFHHTLMDTIIQENVNPIDSLEHSALAMICSLWDFPDSRSIKK